MLELKCLLSSLLRIALPPYSPGLCPEDKTAYFTLSLSACYKPVPTIREAERHSRDRQSVRQHRDPAPRCVGRQTDPPVFRGPGQLRERGWGGWGWAGWEQVGCPSGGLEGS